MTCCFYRFSLSECILKYFLMSRMMSAFWGGRGEAASATFLPRWHEIFSSMGDDI